MKRGRWADHPEVLWQRSRLGIIRVATLETLGMNSATVYRRCQPDGPWQRLLPGVIAMQKGQPTMDQLTAAALLFAGPGAAITGIESCRRHGLRNRELPDEDGLHLLSPHRHKMLSSGFVTIERTRRMPETLIRDEVPVAPLVRSTLDAARRMRATDPVAKLLIEAMQRGRCTPKALSRELEAGSQRGTAIPRRILAEAVDLRSVAELHGRRLADQLAVPPSHWNVELYDAHGNYVGCPDAWWDDVGLGWEIDSMDFHLGQTGYARTLERNTRYTTAGIMIVQTLPSRILREGGAVLRELEAAYRTASGTPRPPVNLSAGSVATT